MFTTFPGMSYLTMIGWYSHSCLFLYPIDLFSDVYHFSAGISGLTYIGLGVGFLTATYGAARIGNNIYANVRRNSFTID